MQTLESYVHQAIENARDNGFWLEGPFDYAAIADDLIEFDSELESRGAEELVPHVKSFFEKEAS